MPALTVISWNIDGFNSFKTTDPFVSAVVGRIINLCDVMLIQEVNLGDGGTALANVLAFANNIDQSAVPINQRVLWKGTRTPRNAPDNVARADSYAIVIKEIIDPVFGSNWFQLTNAIYPAMTASGNNFNGSVFNISIPDPFGGNCLEVFRNPVIFNLALRNISIPFLSFHAPLDADGRLANGRTATAESVRRIADLQEMQTIGLVCGDFNTTRNDIGAPGNAYVPLVTLGYSNPINANTNVKAISNNLASYSDQQYDKILYKFPAGVTSTAAGVIDVVADFQNNGTPLGQLFQNIKGYTPNRVQAVTEYRKISDHLPVRITLNVP